jgi:hypothetical protein
MPDRADLRRACERILRGVGARGRGEWGGFTGYAYHLRRRLSAEEERRVGPAVDIRGTDEARMRRDLLLADIPPAMAALLPEEEVG